MAELVKIVSHDENAVVEVLLNRPEKRNALNQGLLNELLDAIERVGVDHGTRAIILGGVGRSFCAGMDLKAVRSQPERMGELLHAISRVTRAIRRARQPVVARVQGAAIGGGCGLMTVCDFSLTHLEAKIGYPEVDLGICPAVVAPWLIRKIGSGRARQMLLAGGTISGERAFELGLASQLVEAESLDEVALELARDLARGGPQAMATTKHWLNELDGSLDDALLDKAAKLSADIVQADEAQERLAEIYGPADS